MATSRNNAQRQEGLPLYLVSEFMSSARPLGSIERRSSARYLLRAPVLFTFANEKMGAPGSGYVQDISTEGVFVLCPRPVSTDHLIELEILLPPLGTYDTKLVVRYVGLVVRAEETGFAVAAKVTLHRYTTRGRIPILDDEV